MKNIYNISKSQLIVLWVFGVIGWFLALEKADYGSDFGTFLSWFVPLILIFYSIGWKNNKSSKSEGLEEEIESSFLSGIIKKIKHFNFKKLIPLILVLGVIGLIVSGIITKKESGNEMKEFVGRVGRYSNLYEKAQTCRQNLIDSQKPKLISACKEDYNRAYKVYQNCKATMPWSTHYDCVTWPGANYEDIDCSEEKIIKDIIAYDYVCYTEITNEYNYLVNFEKSIVNKFIDNLPKDQTSLSKEEMSEIYSTFPKDVFDEKMMERINEYVKSKGYSVQG